MTSWGNPGIAGPVGVAAGVVVTIGFVLSAFGLHEKTIITIKKYIIDLEQEYIIPNNFTCFIN